MSRILLIENNKQERELYATLLYYDGFEVEQASSAESGLSAAQRRPPDLIIIDYTLQGVDGLYVTKLLKESPLTADIPVICLSESAIPKAKLVSAKADAHLRKPVSGEALVGSIRKLIGSATRSSEATGSAPRVVVIANKESPAAASLLSILQSEGFKVSRAADGVTGLGSVTIVKPELVFAHLNSPVIDGWSVLKRLRQDMQTAKIPVFAFSDAPSAEEEQRALDAGFAAYLLRVDPESVAAPIARYVARTS